MNKILLMKNIIKSVYRTPGHRDVEQPRQLEVGKPACLSVTHHSLTGHTVCDILFGRKMENEKGRASLFLFIFQWKRSQYSRRWTYHKHELNFPASRHILRMRDSPMVVLELLDGGNGGDEIRVDIFISESKTWMVYMERG